MSQTDGWLLTQKLQSRTATKVTVYSFKFTNDFQDKITKKEKKSMTIISCICF